MISPLAQELNTILEPVIAGRMLSDMGKRMYFPKGIIAQSAEAKKLGKKANATIGTAVKNGQPVILPCIQKELPGLSPSEAVGYAPTAGNPELQKLWKDKLVEKNPRLQGKLFSVPVVTPGLTAGVAYLCDLFLSEGEVLLTADPTWDNYALIVCTRCNAVLKQAPMFIESGFNLDNFRKAIMEEAKTGKVRVLLNFPQNPTGYSPTTEESVQIRQILLEAAETGADVLVWCDDAYFGLDYENNIEKQSLFAFLADLHENIMVAKIDGPTKEDYVWGFRSGFLTFAGKGLNEQHYEALTKKLMGIIRSSVSCVSSPAQSILLRACKNPCIEQEKAVFRNMLEERYHKVRNCVDARKNHPVLTAMPFNSGYFMSLTCKGINAEELRLKLLHEYGIGTISIDDSHLRIAYSSVDADMIEETFSAIYQAAEQLHSR